jgi:hypothetical protein
MFARAFVKRLPVGTLVVPARSHGQLTYAMHVRYTCRRCCSPVPVLVYLLLNLSCEPMSLIISPRLTLINVLHNISCIYELSISDPIYVNILAFLTHDT